MGISRRRLSTTDMYSLIEASQQPILDAIHKQEVEDYEQLCRSFGQAGSFLAVNELPLTQDLSTRWSWRQLARFFDFRT
jgi:hypothetical protein